MPEIIRMPVQQKIAARTIIIDMIEAAARLTGDLEALRVLYGDLFRVDEMQQLQTGIRSALSYGTGLSFLHVVKDSLTADIERVRGKDA